MEPLFWISALVSLVGTMILVTQKNAVYALLGLLIAFFATAGIFLSLDAPFIAVSQILIYAGALAVLFLFVLMFTDTRTGEDEPGLPPAIGARPDFDSRSIEEGYKSREIERKPFHGLLNSMVLPKPLAVVVSLAFLVCFSFVIWKLPDSYSSFGEIPTLEQTDYEKEAGIEPHYATGLNAERTRKDGSKVEIERRVEYGTTETVSQTIFEGFPLAFEVVSLLIFTAVLGAVLLARRHLGGSPAPRESGKEQG